MKKFITLLAVSVTVLANAQNFSTFGLSGNPDNLIQNPGADPKTKFHLNYFGMHTDALLSETAGDLFATTDILKNISDLNAPTTTANNSTNINALNLGIKLGKNFVFAGYSQNIDLGVIMDNDLAQFAKYGMEDVNGNLNLSYVGDFSDLGIAVDITNSKTIGIQRSFLEEKLRIGFSASQVGYVSGLRFDANSFNIASTPTSIVGRNELNVNYDCTLAGSNLLDPTYSATDITELNEDVIMPLSMLRSKDFSSLVNYMLGSTQNTNSFAFGTTFEPIKQLTLQFSMSGLGAETFTLSSDYAKKIEGGVAITGFEYVSQAGDTLANTVKQEVNAFTSDIQNGLSTSLNATTYSYSYDLPQVMNAAMNYNLNKNSYVGIHYAARSKSNMDYNYLGFTSLLWLHKNFQLKGGYYMSMDENNLDLVNAVVQFRISPLMQVYVGSSTVGDVATIAANSNKETIMVGAATSRVNFTAGVSMVFFDSRFKKDKDSKKKASDAKSLSPADQKKVDDAYKKSETVKDNK